MHEDQGISLYLITKEKADVSENGRASDSAVARKMYEHDPELDNWYFQFLLIDGELVKERMVADYVMKQMETILVRKHKPQFCAEHMVGKWKMRVDILDS